MNDQLGGYRAQARKRAVFCTLAVSLMILLLSSVQVSLLARFQLFGATPDLMLCFVLCIFYFWGKYAGAVTGIAAGFVIEAIGGQGISLLPVIYMLFGYVGGAYARTVHPKRLIPYLFYLFCGLVLRAAVTLLYACMMWEKVSLPDILLNSVLPEAGGTLIVGILIYAPIKGLCGLVDRVTRV